MEWAKDRLGFLIEPTQAQKQGLNGAPGSDHRKRREERKENLTTQDTESTEKERRQGLFFARPDSFLTVSQARHPREKAQNGMESSLPPQITRNPICGGPVKHTMLISG